MKILFPLSAAAVVMLSGAPADAQHLQHDAQCAVWRHGDCVRWVGRHDHWRVGYVFGRDYAYTDYGALPPTYVARYHLNRRYRYVYSDGNIYVVNPATYAVTRILTAMDH